MSLLQELKTDFDICRNEFKKTFPNIDWDFAISEFNKSKYVKQDEYSWPVYSPEGHEVFMKFVKEELEI